MGNRGGPKDRLYCLQVFTDLTYCIFLETAHLSLGDPYLRGHLHLCLPVVEPHGKNVAFSALVLIQLQTVQYARANFHRYFYIPYLVHYTDCIATIRVDRLVK